MKKLTFLPLILVFLFGTSCSTQKNSSSTTEKELFAVMQIKDTIKIGEAVELDFRVYNRTDSIKKFLKWQTPFEPLLSKYLDIKDEQGEELNYKGAMAKRMMPPLAAAYIMLNPKDSLSVKVDILKGYQLTKPGKYTITYTSEGVSGLKVSRAVTFVYRR